MTAGHDSTFRTIGLSVEVPRRLCVHNVCHVDESRRRQVRLSRQASAPALTLSHAASSMPGQCGSSSAKRCEHVEVTFSGWTCILRQGLEPALTRQSWLRALCFTALPAYFTTVGPGRGPQLKKLGPGARAGAGDAYTCGRTSVRSPAARRGLSIEKRVLRKNLTCVEDSLRSPMPGGLPRI